MESLCRPECRGKLGPQSTVLQKGADFPDDGQATSFWCLCATSGSLTKAVLQPNVVQKTASEQALAGKGSQGWGSPGCELHSSNLRGAEDNERQQPWGTINKWWALILKRGRLHIEAFDTVFPCENEGGAAALVCKVRATVDLRLQGGATQPDTMQTDCERGGTSLTKGSHRCLSACSARPSPQICIGG